MHKVNILIMASMLALSTSTVLAADGKNVKPENCSETGACLGSVSTTNSSEAVKAQIMHQHSLFDGLNLTVKQRQQMRDLIRQNYHDAMPKMYMDNMEAMHNLVIADHFDENAARAQAEFIAKAQVERQVALAKVHHQFYSLLTPEQRIVFNRNHSERMEKMQQHLDQMRKYEELDPQ
ncbi:Periplasmic protein CpxP precursor [Pragia fontium]|uniref:cell-envelope stress modulator CpxP n=1 Tax=Pragia fontium TaxID=82985 RepID=UPI000E088CEF|nr:cell-envelope stress modulator CpxP [Pragia fontium]SUB84018.1 Periplasmic protein CpxP precursor [Pragia fontium]